MNSVLASSRGWSCGCVGPQNGEPLCPCQMRGLVQRGGRWIKPEQDLGPVRGYRVPRFNLHGGDGVLDGTPISENKA